MQVFILNYYTSLIIKSAGEIEQLSVRLGRKSLFRHGNWVSYLATFRFKARRYVQATK